MQNEGIGRIDAARKYVDAKPTNETITTFATVNRIVAGAPSSVSA